MAILKYNGLELEIRYLNKLEDIGSNIVWYELAISMILNGRKIVDDYTLKIKEDNEYWCNRDYFKVMDNDRIDGKKISMPYFIKDVIENNINNKTYTPIENDFELKLMVLENEYKINVEIDHFNLNGVEEIGNDSISLSMKAKKEDFIKFSSDMIDEIYKLKPIEKIDEFLF